MAGEPGHQCKRGVRCAADYQARISGPLLDRIDLRIEVPSVSASDLIRPAAAEPSEAIAKRVLNAREMQHARYSKEVAEDGAPGAIINAHVSNSVIEKAAAPDKEGRQLLEDAANALKFSARGFHRILKVARTLADLEGTEQVGRIHLAEAISYRMAGERLVTA